MHVFTRKNTDVNIPLHLVVLSGIWSFTIKTVFAALTLIFGIGFSAQPIEYFPDFH